MSSEPATIALHAPTALLPGGWARDVRVTIAAGRIAAVEPGAAAMPGGRALAGCALLPALANLHSHSFQRAMAGRAERRGEGPDSFWTWRHLMYRMLDVLTPEDVEAVAAQAFVEMLEAGYAAVGEFHYLHHGPGGEPYADRAELSRRIVAAAGAAGIGLTLLPVLYRRGGTRDEALGGGQLRFATDVDGLLGIAAAAGEGLAFDGVLGAAPHSLRAVAPDEVAALAAALPEAPLHIHVAEQEREVAEVTAAYRARPVELMLGRIGIGPRWCLVHATHMTAAEVAGLAASGAVAGLCPITEANLGDGIFSGAAYQAGGGAFGIGSDSNVRIALAEELRTLEYGQRLRDRARNVLAPPGGSVGAALYLGALAGGARALGRGSGAIRPGALADLVAIERDGPCLGPLEDERILDGWIFAGDDRLVREVWSAGRHVVQGGRHVARARIARRFAARMRAVTAQL